MLAFDEPKPLNVAEGPPQSPLLERIAPERKANAKDKAVPKPIVFTMLFCAVALSASVIRAQSTGDAWTRAVASYHNRSYVEASESFLRLSLASPRDADALANLRPRLPGFARPNFWYERFRAGNCADQ